MTLSQLIKKLECLKDEHGDNQIEFSVKDHYTRYGHKAHTDLRTGDTTGLPSDWNDVSTNSDTKTTTIHLHLDSNYEGKNPKITFR